MAPDETGGAIPKPLFARAHTVVVPAEQDRWLIDDLLARQGVAVIGGDPKLGKSWLAGELAVAIASGEPCLGEFAVRQPGTVLLCSAEGPPWMATDRLRGICKYRALALESLPIHVMADRLIRLDLPEDQALLRSAVETHLPTLLVIDPLTSFHQADENAVGGLNPILQYLDSLRKASGVTVVIAHHASKKAKGTGGHRLRGTTALHAWVDSGLYLREQGGATILTLEQRTGAARGPMILRLVGGDGDHHLDVDPLNDATDAEPDLKERIVAALAGREVPIARDALRKVLGVKNSRLTVPLNELEVEGRLRRDPRGGISLAVPIPAT
ncbi:MAG TPA: AAA family ATPase [Polyangiaceae bacterium]